MLMDHTICMPCQGGKEESAEFRGLAAAVARAAMDDRTVIITCVNQAWAAPGSLLDLFLESFRIGDGTARLLPHVLVVAMDPGAHARCLAVHRHCYHYIIPGLNIDFAAHKYFLSKDYGKDLGKIVTMHANCCVGIGNKIRDLKGVLGDWRNYTRMPPWERHRAKWTVPGACIRAEKQV
ncbi:unnamed protein product [Triticum turgidum subsp. durum]|uniref:Nucleotide-diphospho-sugar transferase domain-containing protein n=1 Tax=Triticum turgidum subsp. durum TaxID=4567 RepID=A0A9R1AU75_TRITD|nr:unnamed protein product [Triticum turgidum subsp. durum]